MQQRRRTSMLQIDRFAESMEEFTIEAEPVINNLRNMAKELDENLRDLVVYYGEDPATIKPEEFFAIIQSFSSSFGRAQLEIHEAKERALRRQCQEGKRAEAAALAAAAAAVANEMAGHKSVPSSPVSHTFLKNRQSLAESVTTL